MKLKLYYYFRFITICLVICSIFVFCGYFYLIRSSQKTANKNTSSIPYSTEEPENAGILLELENDNFFINLNFNKCVVNIILLNEKLSNKEKKIYNYDINYTINDDYSFVSFVVDYLDGIEITLNNEELRYTGVQVVDLLVSQDDNLQLKKDVINKICEKINKKGVDINFFKGIIETTETNLTIPDCYYWSDHFKEVCSSVNFVNF